MKKVLIITYYWPPAGGPGVQRWLKFVKYLPNHEIEPIVYCPENPSYPNLDHTFSSDVDSRITRPNMRTQSGDFEVSLLILASLVIKADGKQDQRELDFVRRQFVQMYGKDRANHAFRLFKAINKQSNISLRQVCLQIQQMMDHAL